MERKGRGDRTVAWVRGLVSRLVILARLITHRLRESQVGKEWNIERNVSRGPLVLFAGRHGRNADRVLGVALHVSWRKYANERCNISICVENEFLPGITTLSQSVICAAHC